MDEFFYKTALLILIIPFLFVRGSFVLMFFVLRALGGDWSMNLELKEGHRLVVSGPYRFIRHQMYTSFLLMMAGQFLIVSNWFVGLFGIVAFTRSAF